MGNPVLTLQQIHQLPYGAERDLAVLKMLASSTPEELKTVITDPASQLHERSAAMKEWAEREPRQCFDWYAGLSPGERDRVNGYDDLTAVLFRTWAEKDPDAALSAARGVAYRGEFADARWEVVAGIMRKDLAKGLKLAFDPAINVPKNSRLTAGLWEQDPGAFVKASGELLSSGVNNRFLDEGRTKALQLWHERDPAAAWEAVVALPRQDRSRMLPQLMGLIIESAGPESAAAQLAAVPEGQAKTMAGRKLLSEWASTDPDAAVAWMNQNVSAERTSAMSRIVSATAETHPEKALQLVAGLEAGPMRDRSIAGLTDSVKNDEEKAAPVLAWLLSQPADAGRREGLGKLTSVWVEKSPEQADAFLKSAAPGDIPDGLASDLAQWHFSKGADSALKWAQGLGEEQRAQAVSSVIYRSAVSGDLENTVGLLRSLPAGEAQDQALQAVIYGSMRSDAEPEALAAALPSALKTAAAAQVRGWKESAYGRAELLKALGAE